MFFRKNQARSPSSRLNKCVLLKKFFQTFNLLQEREIILKKAADYYGVESLDYKKYIVVSTLNKQIATLIDTFNKDPATDTELLEKKAILQFIEEVRSICLNLGKTNLEILETPRNNYRFLINRVIKSGTFITAISLVYLNPISLLESFLIIYGAIKFSAFTRHVSGLDDPLPASFKLFITLTNDLFFAFNVLLMDVEKTHLPNYYEVLEVSPDATQKEIHSAYIKKARASHPDKGGDKETFIKVTQAHDILSVPESREVYDKNFSAQTSLDFHFR